MGYYNLLKKFILCFICAIFLAACGAKEETQDPGTVQDIEPGQKSVIDSPAPAQNGKIIEERNI